MKKSDWRLTNQKDYLFKKKLKKSKYQPYRQGWEHDHCAFCSDRIDENSGEAYCTEDKYFWICPECYDDFKNMFEWEVEKL